jgi:outer membrane protein OmpA-like peptidoglycan-associated protein
MDEYHRNNDWPKPYSGLAEQSVRVPLDIQAENARQHLATLWDFHFDSGTAQLNSMGQKRLQAIVAQAGAGGQVVFVQRTPSTAETELRLEEVRKQLSQLDLGDVNFDVAEARVKPTEIVGKEAVHAVKRLTDPQTKEGKTTYSSGGGDFKDSGGSGGGN